MTLLPMGQSVLLLSGGLAKAHGPVHFRATHHALVIRPTFRGFIGRASPMSFRSFRSSLGSSGISGEWSSYLQEEVLMVTVSVRHSFDDLDLVVEALDQACM